MGLIGTVVRRKKLYGYLFAYDTLIFADTFEGLNAFPDALARESEGLGLGVSWDKTAI